MILTSAQIAFFILCVVFGSAGNENNCEVRRESGGDGGFGSCRL